MSMILVKELLIVCALYSCCQQVEANVCANPVSKQPITSCSSLTLQDSEGLYNVGVVNGSVPLRCLYCAKLPNRTGWWYRFGKGGMSAIWKYQYEWRASKLLTIIDKSDVATMNLLNISQMEVATDVRFEIRTSYSVNPTSATVRFTPALTKATIQIPNLTGGQNTGVCILKFPLHTNGQYDGSRIFCSNQGENMKCGAGNLPANGDTTRSLFVEEVNIDPQGKGAFASSGQWTRNAVYWHGSYYYVYVQEAGHKASVPVTPQTVVSNALGSTQSSTRFQTQSSTATLSTTLNTPTDSETLTTPQRSRAPPTTTNSFTSPPRTRTTTVTVTTSSTLTSPMTTHSTDSEESSASTSQIHVPTSRPPGTKQIQWVSNLRKLAEVPVTRDTAFNVSVQLSSLSQNNSFQMDNTSVLNVVSILENIAKTRPTNDTEIVRNIFRTASSILAVPRKSMLQSQQGGKASSRMSELLENTVLSLSVSTDERAVGLKSPNIVAHRIAISNLERYRTYNYSFYKGTSDDYVNSKTVLGDDTASPNSLPDVAVRIPQSVLQRAHASLGRRPLPLGIIVYRNDTLFPREKQHNTTTYRINSNVISVSFSNKSLTNLSEPVTVTFQHADKCGEEPSCVFWKSTSSGEYWSEEGCVVVATRDGSTNCHCNHLTNFALLMNMDGPNRATCLGKGNKLAISIITYVGCSLSLFGLVLTVLTLTIFPKQLKNRPNKILINLCLALIALIVSFWAGIDRTSNQIACKAAGALIHYFTLSALLWMGIEAFNLCLLLVLVFSRDINHFMLKCIIIGWGVPAVIVATTAGQSTDNYGGIKYCHVTHPAYIYALVTPAAIILLTNFIFFVFVMRAMCQSWQQSAIKKDDTSSRPRAAFSVVVLTGLTWAFGFLTVSDVSIVFQYLFAIFNTTQGFFIFIFYCLRREEMRNQWLIFLRGRGRHTVRRASQMTERRTMSTTKGGNKSKKVSSSSLYGDAVSVRSLQSESVTKSTSMSMLMPSDNVKRKYSFKEMLGKFKKKDKAASNNSVGDILHELHRLEGSGLSSSN